MLNHPEVKQKFEREVATRNEKLTAYKQVKKFVILPDVWSLETGELTVTMKVKRRIIMSKYASQIAAMYGG
jgi:long-chain acyl-CoA synthetase